MRAQYKSIGAYEQKCSAPLPPQDALHRTTYMKAVEVAAQSAAATAYRAKIIVAILDGVNYDYSKGLPKREKMLDTTRR